MPGPEEQSQQTIGSMIDGMPWWIKATLVVYNTAGLPTLLLAYSMMQQAGVIPNPVQGQLDTLVGELQEIKGAVLSGTASMKDIVKVMDEQRQQRQMRCVVKAKTDQEKLACFPAKKLEE